MEEDSSWEAGIPLANERIPCRFEIRIFINLFIRTRYWYSIYTDPNKSSAPFLFLII
jgi:hypothetical protein